MVRVYKQSKKPKHFCRTKHKACGAIVEFSKGDVANTMEKMFDALSVENYVVCPYCKEKIPSSTLKWRWE